MTRAYAFLSLLIITGALRPLSLAQEPSPQSPKINRQSFVAEVMRRRLSRVSSATDRARRPRALQETSGEKR